MLSEDIPQDGPLRWGRLRFPLAVHSAGELADLQLHQPLGSEADHLAQQVGVWSILDQCPQAHHLVGHRWSLGQVGIGNPTLPSIVDDHRQPARAPACCGRARERLRYRPATPSPGTRPTLVSLCRILCIIRLRTSGETLSTKDTPPRHWASVTKVVERKTLYCRSPPSKARSKPVIDRRPRNECFSDLCARGQRSTVQSIRLVKS